LRLDLYLVEKKLVENRSKAKDLILNNKVTIDGVILKKPSIVMDLAKEYDIYIDNEELFVSRAGNKLHNFLKSISFDIKGLNCLDIGSSTGGFSQVLLQNEVLSINCVDVGSDQLHGIVRNDKRVTVNENCDIRDFKSDIIFDLVTCDVSFISILHIIDSIDFFAHDKIIILFKPQFEVGKNVKRDKKGVVKDEFAIQKSCEAFEKKCLELNWKLIKKDVSKIKGKDGNVEYFYYFEK
jgi:23S rRNA (cytidine1920-2'-O)/16S rRNA (cytidine1409-2'-O)-methyltransferase